MLCNVFLGLRNARRIRAEVTSMNNTVTRDLNPWLPGEFLVDQYEPLMHDQDQDRGKFQEVYYLAQTLFSEQSIIRKRMSQVGVNSDISDARQRLLDSLVSGNKISDFNTRSTLRVKEFVYQTICKDTCPEIKALFASVVDEKSKWVHHVQFHHLIYGRSQKWGYCTDYVCDFVMALAGLVTNVAISSMHTEDLCELILRNGANDEQVHSRPRSLATEIRQNGYKEYTPFIRQSAMHETI